MWGSSAAHDVETDHTAAMEADMSEQLTRTELVELVHKLMNADGTEDEIATWLKQVESNVPDPEVSDIIYWPNVRGLPDDLTAAQIVDIASHFKSIALPMATEQHHNDQESASQRSDKPSAN